MIQIVVVSLFPRAWERLKGNFVIVLTADEKYERAVEVIIR